MARRTYHGSCHCGAVKFEVEGDLSILGVCNCSICTKKGAFHHTVPPERFKLLEGEDDLKLYQFNKKIAEHYFCSHCGIQTFSHPRTAPKNYNVNIRCLDDFDVNTAEFEVRHFDGRNWEQAFAKHQAERK